MEYRGIAWRNDSDLSKKIGKHRSYVFAMCKNCNKTHEEIIDKYLDSDHKYTYRGISWKNDSDLARKLNTNRHYIYYHKKHKKSYREIIDYTLNKKSKIIESNNTNHMR